MSLASLRRMVLVALKAGVIMAVALAGAVAMFWPKTFGILCRMGSKCLYVPRNFACTRLFCYVLMRYEPCLALERAIRRAPDPVEEYFAVVSSSCSSDRSSSKHM